MKENKENDSVKDFINIIEEVCNKFKKLDIEFEVETTREEDKFSVNFKLKSNERSDINVWIGSSNEKKYNKKCKANT